MNPSAWSKEGPRTRLRVAWALRTVLMVLALAAFAPAVRAQDAPSGSLFGAVETGPFTPIDLFPDWMSVLDRMRQTPEPFTDACEFPELGRCKLRTWNSFLESIRGQDRESMVREVNDEMNHFLYVPNAHWETPLEFYFMNGDCKDYAVAKYASLRYLGFFPDELRIVVGKDTHAQVEHAILVVYLDGKAIVLDNRISRVINASNVYDFRPTYSVNEVSYWLYRS
jgi:predicted transglutaminase-like cysteine proteinase